MGEMIGPSSRFARLSCASGRALEDLCVDGRLDPRRGSRRARVCHPSRRAVRPIVLRVTGSITTVSRTG